MKAKHFILLATSALLIASGLTSCLKSKVYKCWQYVKINDEITPISVIDFDNKKNFDAFKGDSVQLNDSTLIYWECRIAI